MRPATDEQAEWFSHWFNALLDNVEQVIKDGYRVLMAPSTRSYAVLSKGRAAAGRS